VNILSDKGEAFRCPDCRGRLSTSYHGRCRISSATSVSKSRWMRSRSGKSVSRQELKHQSAILYGVFIDISGGWGGIRTHGGREPTPVFKTGALNRSATHPRPLALAAKAAVVTERARAFRRCGRDSGAAIN
jgi:hypothetical protein